MGEFAEMEIERWMNEEFGIEDFSLLRNHARKREVSNFPPKDPSSPSASRTKKVLKHPCFPIPTHCRYCQSPVRWSDNKEIYGKSYGPWPFVYQCTSCDAYVGMHQFTAIPLGSLAQQALRDKRKEAKALFNLLDRRGNYTRSEAYAHLANILGIEYEHCHFGWFDIDKCEQVIAYFEATK